VKNPVDLPPGEIYDIKDSIALPADLKQGKYRFSVGIVGVDSDKPVVQLGIKGRTNDGWYPLSEITITR